MSGFGTVLVRIRAVLERVELGLLTALLAALICLSFAQVVLRQFQQGLVWADVLIRHLVLWIGMLGAVLAASRSRHIRIDALGRLLTGRIARVVGMLLDGLSAWICWRLGQAGVSFLQMSIEFEEVIEGLDWAAWTLQSIIPIAFYAMAFHFLLNLPLRWLAPERVPEALPLVADPEGGTC